ncbi:MAG: methionine--tRNA ligase [Candidatus Altiarchaeota archaeon]|nr:methionine--tRNA ligase [Candidatus Altiarchaeota archaeon]
MEKTVITAALPYANGELHLGHIKSTYLPADIYTKFLKFIGLPAIYLCANDEHGTPILLKSDDEKIAPEEYIKQWRTRHLNDLNFVLIDFDKFYATHSPEHLSLTQEIYNKLKKAGHIKRGKVKQYWDSIENTPLPDRYVIGTCPHCDALEQYGDQCEKCAKVFVGGELKNPVAKRTGNKAEVREGEHVFFKLSTFSDKLKKFVEEIEAPQDVKNFVLGWVKDGLQDWDIERDIKWGIDVPDSNGVFYVWFDAPIGYYSTLKKWCIDNNENFKDWWNGKVVHFIGKDIAYHHFLFWPAMLMGAGLNVPSSIPTRGHLTLENKKFSKSRNWYISIKDWKDNGLDPEYLRFYMTYTTPLGSRDSDFSTTEFQKTVNEELVNNFGNLLQRLLKFVERFDSKLTEKPGEVFDKVQASLTLFEELMKAGELSKALQLVSKHTHKLNVYFQGKEPWKNESEAPSVIANIASSLKLINMMLYPFLPKKTKQVAELLNVKLEWDNSPLPIGHKLKPAKILFPKVDDTVSKKLKSIYNA